MSWSWYPPSRSDFETEQEYQSALKKYWADEPLNE